MGGSQQDAKQQIAQLDSSVLMSSTIELPRECEEEIKNKMNRRKERKTHKERRPHTEEFILVS